MFERSATTIKLCEILRTVNGSIGYQTLTSATGTTLGKLRPALQSARAILEKEKIAFAVERGHGLRRLSDSETVQSTEKFKQKLRSTSKRGLKRLGAVSEYSKLSSADQMTATLARTLFETVKVHTSVRPASKAAAVPTPDLARIMPQAAE
jgi:hypothetical protein